MNQWNESSCLKRCGESAFFCGRSRLSRVLMGWRFSTCWLFGRPDAAPCVCSTGITPAQWLWSCCSLNEWSRPDYQEVWRARWNLQNSFVTGNTAEALSEKREAHPPCLKSVSSNTNPHIPAQRNWRHQRFLLRRLHCCIEHRIPIIHQ